MKKAAHEIVSNVHFQCLEASKIWRLGISIIESVYVWLMTLWFIFTSNETRTCSLKWKHGFFHWNRCGHFLGYTLNVPESSDYFTLTVLHIEAKIWANNHFLEMLVVLHFFLFLRCEFNRNFSYKIWIVSVSATTVTLVKIDISSSNLENIRST